MFAKKALVSLVNQLGQINALQKSLETPLQLHITGVGPKTQARLDQMSADKWIMKFHAENFDELFDHGKLVYLSGDAEQTMENFNPEFSYKSDLHYRRLGRSQQIEEQNASEIHRARNSVVETTDRGTLETENFKHFDGKPMYAKQATKFYCACTISKAGTKR